MADIIGTMIGGCTIESKIGQGGMGEVYKAHHIALDIPVAVKIVLHNADIPDAGERFMREARIAARIKHPNIAAVLNVGVDDGRHYIVMEYVDGESLKSIVERRSKLPEQEVIPIALALLSALQKAHECSVVHRDIKPENILIDSAGTVRLIDMGLARSVTCCSLTQPNTVLGSPHYVAPEQADNPSAADCRSDIYSLGCTLYHLLSGSIPFPGTSVIEVLMNHLNKPAPALCGIVPSLSCGISDIVEKMMQKDPQKRFQTPAQAYDAFLHLSTSGVTTGASASNKSRRKRSEQRAVVIASCLLIGIVVMVAIRWGKPAVMRQISVVEEQVKVTQKSVPVDKEEDAAETIKNDTKRENEKSVPPPPKVKVPLTPKKVVAAKVLQNNNVKTVNAGRSASPVLSAVKIGDVEELSRLLKDGLSPNGLSTDPSTPLHEAVKRGLSEATRTLLVSGANPNSKDSKGNTPLHYALRDDAAFLTELLLKSGADPNITDSRGRTPLAIAKGVSSSMEQLVKSRGGR